MLNLKNMREVTRKMLTDARIYTEIFWQKIFDIPHFDASGCSICILEFSEVEPVTEELDPVKVFEELYFIVEYNCYGDISVNFNPNTSAEDVALRLSAEYLTKNHFTQLSNFKFVLKNINAI